jgi:hypothetical protein
MTARELEAALLTRCAGVACEITPTAQDQREANVFELAARVVRARFPREAARLLQASKTYFAAHPGDRLAAADVVRQGWVQSLPRLRDMLSQQFHGL